MIRDNSGVPRTRGKQVLTGGTTLTQTYSTADATHAARTAAALTEDSGAIGGTNDGDLPALTPLTVADGAGTNDGTIGAITGDASVIAAVQELAAQVNNCIDSIRELAAMVNALRVDQVDTAQFANSLANILQGE